MPLDEHPNVLRHDGRLWVSDIPRERLRAQIADQRAWDAVTARRERWGLAISLGAVAGVLVTVGIATLAGAPPVANVFILPVGFAVGAVLGAVVNKRILARAPRVPDRGPRPTVATMVRIPPEVVKRAPVDAGVEQLIRWSTRGRVD